MSTITTTPTVCQPSIHYQWKRWAAFRAPPLRHCREIWSAFLLGTKFCLENGDLHRGQPFVIKRTTLIGCTGGHFRGALYLHSEVGDASEADPECKLGKMALPSRLWDVPWTQLWTELYVSMGLCKPLFMWWRHYVNVPSFKCIYLSLLL